MCRILPRRCFTFRQVLVLFFNLHGFCSAQINRVFLVLVPVPFLVFLLLLTTTTTPTTTTTTITTITTTTTTTIIIIIIIIIM